MKAVSCIDQYTWNGLSSGRSDFLDRAGRRQQVIGAETLYTVETQVAIALALAITYRRMAVWLVHTQDLHHPKT